MLAKIGASLLGRGNVEQKPSKGHLDLDLSSDPELSAAFEAAVAEGGRDSLCAVLRRCAERPSALSIARTDDETGPRLLPHILMELHTAADLLTSLSEARRQSVGGSFSSSSGAAAAAAAAAGGGAVPLLPWEECEGALALLHGGSTLFVQLAATPQHRRLLQQHGLPAALQHVVTALADCMHRLGGEPDALPPATGGAAAGILAAAERPSRPDATGGGSGGGGGGAAGEEGRRQQLVVLAALEAALLLLGCLWQAGFAAVHAAPALEGGAPAPHRQARRVSAPDPRRRIPRAPVSPPPALPAPAPAVAPRAMGP